MSPPVRELFGLAGRTALVAGGSRGLGLQFAQALGEAGARVLPSSRKAEDLEAAAASPRSGGTGADGIAAGCGREDDTRRLADETLVRFGAVDTLLSNAGASRGAPAEDHPVAAWHRLPYAGRAGKRITGPWLAVDGGVSVVPGA